MTTNKKKLTTTTKSTTKKAESAKKTPAKKTVSKNEKTATTANESAASKTTKEVQKKPTNAGSNARRRIVTNYSNLSSELLEKLNEKYPLGWLNYIIKIDKGNGETFHAVMLDTEDTSYLIKVPVKVDLEITDEVEKDIFGSEIVGGDEDFPVDDDEDKESYDDSDDV